MANVFDHQAALLKIYVEETACKDGQKAAEWIACRACEMGLAGASVFRGIGGYFANAPIVAPEFFDFRLAHPLLIEIVDQAAKIDEFSAFLKAEVGDLLMIQVPVSVCMS